MSAQTKIRVVVAEHIIGDVMGQLSASGATLEGLDSVSGRMVILASTPAEALAPFEQWLHRLTNGDGRVEIATK